MNLHAFLKTALSVALLFLVTQFPPANAAAPATGELPSAEKSGILPYLQNPAPDGITVCFLSLHATDVSVLVFDENEVPLKTVRAAGVKIPKTTWTIWKARISGLTPATRHIYKITYDECNVSKSSAPYCFTTFDDKTPKVRAAVFNDIHNRITTLEALLSHVKPGDCDFTIWLGDMWHDPSPANNAARVFDTMEAYVRLFDASNKPVFFVRGNHETRGAFASELSYLFDLPSNDPTARFADQNAYHDFRAGPVWFIAPDAGEDKEKLLEIFSPYRQRQAGWLAKLFSESGNRTAPWRVLAIHIPLYNDEWWDQPDALMRWAPILNKADIDIMISGHDHGWKKLNKGKTYARVKKTENGGIIQDHVTPPFPVLIGGGPALKPPEIATVMLLEATTQTLSIRLVGPQGDVLSTVDLRK